jgi:ADP-heptose:LPS heptosyltransferase
MESWSGCRNILCIRLDNIGDVLMSSPAIRALRSSFDCKITLLTSTGAKIVAPLIDCLDEVLTYDVPWVKSETHDAVQSYFKMVNLLDAKHFDACVVFTVFSQNPLPSIMLAYLAKIPRRLAYCRENPYKLITHWIPDKEPYSLIRHQVVRDLALVKAIGALTTDDTVTLRLNQNVWTAARGKLSTAGVRLDQRWILIHPAVSEEKRQYPLELWIESGKRLVNELGVQLLVTGAAADEALTQQIANGIGNNCFPIAGLLTLEEFALLISRSPLVISVNTSTIHIAAAVGTATIVLYALTNPQHAPWKGKGKILPFPVEAGQESKNEVLRFLQQTFFHQRIPMVSPEEIVSAAREILLQNIVGDIPELVLPESTIPA